MSDIALLFDPIDGPDIAIDGAGIQLDEGMHTAILISLLTDARAPDAAELPHEDADRRGWWGNDFPREVDAQGSELGSLLWLLEREIITPERIARARDAAYAALRWIVADQIASAIRIDVEVQQRKRIALSVHLDRPTGPARQRYDFLWEASA